MLRLFELKYDQSENALQWANQNPC
jgi:hypothetical protein